VEIIGTPAGEPTADALDGEMCRASACLLQIPAPTFILVALVIKVVCIAKINITSRGKYSATSRRNAKIVSPSKWSCIKPFHTFFLVGVLPVVDCLSSNAFDLGNFSFDPSGRAIFSFYRSPALKITGLRL